MGGVPDGEHPAPTGDVHHQERPGLRQEPARDADTGTVMVVMLDGIPKHVRVEENSPCRCMQMP